MENNLTRDASNSLNIDGNDSNIEGTASQNPREPRISSALRMKYDAEVALVKHRWGDLEAIRKNLGLSQRKICQLLFVDPSAWTRWTRNEGDAPPHIYRALSWFLLLQEKHPETAPYQWLQAVARPQLPEIEIQKIRSKLESELQAQLQKALGTKTKVLLGLIALNLVLFVALLSYF